MSRVFGNVNINQKLCTPNICSIAPTGTIRLQNSLIPLSSKEVSLGDPLTSFKSVYVEAQTIYIGDTTISSTGTSLVTSSINLESLTLLGPSGNNISMITTNNGIEITGTTGYIGVVGPIGPQGIIGETGPQGDIGSVGFQGDIGATGPQGDIGATGSQGDTGATGPQGDIGPAGPQGSEGIAGIALNKGPTGPQGPTGIYSLSTETLLTTGAISPTVDVSFLGNNTYTLSSGVSNGFSKTIIDINNFNNISAPFNVTGNIQLSNTGSIFQSTWSSSLNQWVISSYQGVTGSSGFKTFVIDHPIHSDRYLVHACLEGPEAGVYYRGIGEIELGEKFTEISLPYYTSKLASDFTIDITPIWNGHLRTLNFTEVEDNKFRVYGEPGKFYWIVHGSRSEIEVEPFKNRTELKGEGPYKWL